MGPIICVCTGNICRSPMAERLLQRGLTDAGITDVLVTSAGVAAYDGQPASSYSVKALEEIGLDLKNHRSQLLTRKMIEEASLILVMTQMHRFAIEEEHGAVKTPIMLWREFMPQQKQVADPYGADYASYKAAYQSIAEAVPTLVAHVKKIKG